MYKFTTFLSLPLILLLWISGNTLAAHTELAVAPSDTVFIPDANFKNGLLNLGIDLNNDGEIQYSEAESWTAQIKLPGEGIADITGIAAFTNVTDLRLHYNSLTTLDLRANPNLELIHVQHNNISTVYLSASSELSMLRIQNNALQELDLSQNRKLRYLETQNNQLQSLNVQNGNNTMMYKFNATGNPDLLCIQVDDVAYADANFSSGKDARAAFDLNCSSEPDIINFKPTLTASNTTDLPMPPTTADKSLKLITDTGYTGYRLSLIHI